MELLVQAKKYPTQGVCKLMKGKVLITGAGGFIGHHLTSFLREKDYWVRGVDIKEPEYAATSSTEFELLDLRKREDCLHAVRDVDYVYHLAADMGGIGYITAYLADIARNDTLINLHMIEACRINNIQKFFFSSSACIYPGYMQESSDVDPLKEEDAYPADPEEGYGWEKLFMEKMCQYYTHDYGLETRVARFHNVYGPLGTFDGGREKSPAAICRKVAKAQDGGEIEIWGDGKQTRSFMYIDDCVDGIYKIMNSDVSEPLNLGTDRLITINELVDIVSSVAGKNLIKKHDLTKPQGVRGRNSDNTKLTQLIGWFPEYSLESGLGETYQWISNQLS